MTFPILPGSNPTGYNLTRSLRFRSSASAYLNRTPVSASNRKTWTFSAWVKRGKLGAYQDIFSAGLGTGGGSDETFLRFAFTSSDQLYISGNQNVWLTTNAVYRDPSAWYHIVLYFDATQATATNRILFYVNRVQVTSFATNNLAAYVSNQNYAVNNTVPQVIGIESGSSAPPSGTFYLDGYLTEVNFIDGQALTPSSFGATNALTGVWQPARYTGTYGTNGFYLPFTDNSALTTSSNVGLGKDFSGNGNYWTTNNISITSGVTYDSMTDVPTLTSATAANYCVLSPIDKSSGLNLTDGNLLSTFASGGWNINRATIAVTTGQWYWEVYVSNNASNGIGIANNSAGLTDSPGVNTNNAMYLSNGTFYYAGTSVNIGAGFSTGDVMGVAFDAGTNKLTFYRNGTVVNSGGTSTSVTGGLYFPATDLAGGANTFNFGQRPFTYTPPTGYVALNAYNLPTPTILAGNKYMDATLWTGNGTSQSITNSGSMKPDFVWIKGRSATTYNILTDSVRGTNSQLFSNDTLAQESRTDRLTAFNSNGFSLGNWNDVNNNAATYVGWQWQAGQGTTSSNTSGSITSTVSVNATAGFSVVTFTGTGANATVGHGLGVAPSMVIVKARSFVQDWVVYHQSLGNTNAMFLDLTNASTANILYWNNTSPTSSVVSLGSGNGVNSSTNTYVAYCFAPIAGYSAFGSYTGNGSSDGSFVYTGFRPKFVMIKSTSTGGWVMLDTSRDAYNVSQNYLYAQSSGAEASGSPVADILSNGFKPRTTWTDVNPSGTGVIYMAFAENPLKYALAR